MLDYNNWCDINLDVSECDLESEYLEYCLAYQAQAEGFYELEANNTTL